MNDEIYVDTHDMASPGLTAGSGLKLSRRRALFNHFSASPGLTAGSGLKQLIEDRSDTLFVGHLPA